MLFSMRYLLTSHAKSIAERGIVVVEASFVKVRSGFRKAVFLLYNGWEIPRSLRSAPLDAERLARTFHAERGTRGTRGLNAYFTSGGGK